MEFRYSHNRFAQLASGHVRVNGETSLISEALSHRMPNAAANLQWDRFSDTFIADSATTTLKLEGASENGEYGFVVDDIRVTAASRPAASCRPGLNGRL